MTNISRKYCGAWVAPRTAALVLTLVGTIHIAIACGGQTEGTANAGSIEALSAFPYETTADWVGYADAVVVAQVTGEDKLPITEGERQAQEGLIMRTVKVSLREILWERSNAPRVPEDISFIAYGWTFDGDELRAASTSQGARLEVGNTYLIPIASSELGGWGPINPTQTFDYEGSSVTVLEDVDPGSAGAAISGRKGAEVADLLASTDADPLTLKYADLGPVARFEAVAAESER